MSNATHRSTPSFAVVVERKCNAYFPDIPTSIWEKGSKSSAYHAFVKFRLRILKTAITVAVLTDFWDPKHAVIGVVFIKITYRPELCANRGDIKFVEKMLAAAAMQYMDEVGTSVAAGYKLDRLTPAERMIRVGELLCEYSWLEDNDYRTRKYPFAGEAMIGAIGSCYAWTDRECRIGEINRQVILLTATGLYHGLKALISGVYVADPKELDTYRGEPDQSRTINCEG